MWRRLENHPGEKYELKISGVLLGTIFHKPTTNRYSIWISCPIGVKKIRSMISDSYDYATLDDAKNGFDEILRDKYDPWITAVKQYLNLEDTMCEECRKYPADFPSKLCVGCDSYKEHLH